MKSKWFELKEEAIKLRKEGFSITKIENQLGISRSTLSGWFRKIKLTENQRRILLQNQRNALVEARKKAVLWHNEQKRKRLTEAKRTARETLERINTGNNDFFELALAFLYLGEGAKKNPETAIGSSDPIILKFFLAAMKNIYKVNINNIKCELSLRADQNSEKIKQYWAMTLGLPIDNFKQVNIDNRTKGRATYSYYKGVCHLRCGNIAIQRKLVLLANLFCEKMISKKSGI